MSDIKKPEPAPLARPAPPPPKHPGMVTFRVDGQEVVVAPGTNMIDAAKSVGVHIPYYCYHPRLSIAANCRMCMVESSGAPAGKLVPACQTGIAEGVEISTTSQTVCDQQRKVMEFLLLNHPVDCAICDQSGECKLQDYYMRFDHRRSRLLGDKIMRTKRKVLNDLVVIDQERCVLCTRCVRFMDEVAKTPQLGVFGRGSSERVDLPPGTEKLESNYTGNIVDICPVGALLNRDFRFQARAWFLTTTPSICVGCSRGCSIQADTMGQDVYRYRPRENEAINKSWLCDQGRLSYRAINGPRPAQSAIGTGSSRRASLTSEAVAHTAAHLRKGSVAVAVSPALSNEDILAALTFARDTLGSASVYVTGSAPGEADFFLMTADKNPNRRGLTAIAAGLGVALLPFEKLRVDLDGNSFQQLLLFGHQVPEGDAAFAKRLAKLDFVAVVAAGISEVTITANTVLAATSHLEDEGSFIQESGIIQRTRCAFPPRAECMPIWKWSVALSKELGGALTGTSSREVFLAYKNAVIELRDFDWDAAAPRNQLRPGIGTLPAGADGRPPGWREQGIPSMHGLSLEQAT